MTKQEKAISDEMIKLKQYQREAIQHRQNKLERSEADSFRDIGNCYNNLAKLYLDTDVAQARELYRKAIETFEVVVEMYKKLGLNTNDLIKDMKIINEKLNEIS